MSRAYKWLAGLLAGILITCGMPAIASENLEQPDLSKKGSISIDFRDSETNEPFSFGSKVGLFKAADLIENKGYSFVYDELFESVGPVPMTAAEYTPELADRLEETAEYKGISLDVPSEEISEAGSVVFQSGSGTLSCRPDTQRNGQPAISDRAVSDNSTGPSK
jgi:hypothetical protein